MHNSQIIVVAAIIQYSDMLLITQRDSKVTDLQPGKWEFPGGKVEYAEKPINALIREIKEELNLEIHDINLFDVTSGLLSNEKETIHAVMITYTCKSDSTKLVARVHSNYKWVKTDQLANYQWAVLDIPIINRLLAFS